MLNPNEELNIKKMKDKCRELGIMPAPDIIIGLEVRKKGKSIYRDFQRG